jgi:hypothetical protein
MHGVRIIALFALVAPAVCGFGPALTACGTMEMWFYYADAGADADNDQDAGPDGGEGCPPEACTGRTLQWDGPTWLWSGPVDQAPNCPPGPDGSVNPAWEGNADLVAPLACEPCRCDPSIGSCTLPSVLTASTVACGQPGGTSISFDAPMPWDGMCDNTTQVPAGAVNSLTIQPLIAVEEGCAPRLPRVPALTPPVVPPSWKTLARSCHGQGWSPCGDPLGTCIPKDIVPPPGFRLCISREGDLPCNTADWPDKLPLFYEDVEDARTCSECTCGPPVGSMCTARLSVYANNDNTCRGLLPRLCGVWSDST